MSQGERVFLYGPSGSGKSTLGRVLAQALGYPFIDLDQEIQTAAGQSIEQIFAVEGESGFRQRETQALETACQRRQVVVALGGGCLLAPANRQLADSMGTVLRLDASYEILLQRLFADPMQRPLLQGGAKAKLKKTCCKLAHRIMPPFRCCWIQVLRIFTIWPGRHSVYWGCSTSRACRLPMMCV